MTTFMKTNAKNHLKNNKGTNLLTQIVKKQFNSQQPVTQQQKQCLYGLLCAHLRAQGKCRFPHKRSHYHFLNLVPPIGCINDDQQGKELSKVQKKQQKIIEKTINQHIDVSKLNKIQHQIKNGGEQLIKKEIWQQIDEKEKKILEIVNSFDVSEIFIKLNEAKSEGLPLFEVKRKATIQLKKKNEKLYNQMLDKEYRIANRMIKAYAKNKSLSLYDLYVDINHDTIKSIRTYFESYFKEEEGIPQESQASQETQVQGKLYIKSLFQKLLFVKPEQYQNQFYVLKLIDFSIVSELRANIELYNMLVPFSLHKQQPFNKFYLVDCSQLTFKAFSNLLSKEYVSTFHAKFKAAPEYLFGQLEQNQAKFLNWAAKIHSKFAESQTEFKTIFILYNITSILQKGELQQFQMQKLRQRVALLKNLVALFNSVMIVLAGEGIKNSKKNLCKVFQVENNQISNSLTLE